MTKNTQWEAPVGKLRYELCSPLETCWKITPSAFYLWGKEFICTFKAPLIQTIIVESFALQNGRFLSVFQRILNQRLASVNVKL